MRSALLPVVVLVGNLCPTQTSPFRKILPYCCKKPYMHVAPAVAPPTAEDHLSCMVGRISKSHFKRLQEVKNIVKDLNLQSPLKKTGVPGDSKQKRGELVITKSLQIQTLHSKLWLILLSSACQVLPTPRPSWRAMYIVYIYRWRSFHHVLDIQSISGSTEPIKN